MDRLAIVGLNTTVSCQAFGGVKRFSIFGAAGVSVVVAAYCGVLLGFCPTSPRPFDAVRLGSSLYAAPTC